MDPMTVIVTGEAAENLLNYLVAYRNLRRGLNFDLENRTLLEDNITIGLIPQEEPWLART